MIEINKLTKTYLVSGQRFHAAEEVDLTVASGEMISIIGHSGSGKTTLLSLIGGLTRPDSGQVVIDGVDLWSMPDDRLAEFRNRKLSFVYQFASLIPTLTALENVLLPTAFGEYRQDVMTNAQELLSSVGLADKGDFYPSQLSGGQQRRVAIARAFINQPEIILADEPTGDLDEETEQEVISLFRKMNTERGVTFVVVTHNNQIARRLGRLMTMKNGRLSETADEIGQAAN
jgi:ABC-type lipoprotein export system ATPase subunit